MIHALLGGKRVAHVRHLQDDRAVAAILRLKRGRIYGEDAIVQIMRRAERNKAC